MVVVITIMYAFHSKAYTPAHAEAPETSEVLKDILASLKT